MAKENVSAQDQALLDQYSKMWNTANAAGDQAGMDAAHAAAEAVRAGYGYSGGMDGSQNIAIAQPNTYAAGTPVSAQDKGLINQYSKMWNDANAAGDQASMDAAHAAAERVRAQYGYSGGNDGSGYVLLNQAEEKKATTPAAQTYGGGNNDLSQYIRDSYAAQIEAELAGLKGAYENAIRGYDDETGKVNDFYQDARNRAAAQDAIARRNFDERAVANGLNTGTTGQAELARESGYIGNLAGIDEQNNTALSDIEMRRANTQAEYEAAIAQAQAENNASMANALYEELIRQQNIQMQQDAIAREEAQRAQELALKYGLADPTGLAAIGSIADLSNIGGTNANGGISVGTVGAQGGGGNGGAGYDNGNLTAAQVAEMQRYYGANPDGLWGTNSTAAAGGKDANAAWAAYQKAKGGTPATPATPTASNGGYSQEDIAAAAQAGDLYGMMAMLGGVGGEKNMLTSSQAIRMASAAGSSAAEQTEKLIELNQQGRITDKQTKDLVDAITNPGK